MPCTAPLHYALPNECHCENNGDSCCFCEWSKRVIKTEYVYPPIPIRNFDWQAWDDNSYDGPGSPLGHGATEAAAIADLREQL